MRRTAASALMAVSLVCLASPSAFALEECRLLRQPDIQGGRIVFSYAGDLWTVPRAGGMASRLTSHDGLERFPKLSPDGQTIAFTAEYDGNVDAFTIPAVGGEPRRLTWHPGGDQVAEWYPDGSSILLRSARASFIGRFDRFLRVPAQGGFEELLALPQAGYAGFSPDGKAIAFITPSYDNRTWKRYKGGNAPEIWVYDFAANTSEKVTDWAGADEWPMWHGRTIYYSTDRGGRTVNLWAYDLDRKTHRQVTRFDEYDVKWPSIGSDGIVFENGGYLHVMELPGEKTTRLQVLVPDDRPATRPAWRNVAAWTNGWDLSPSAKRAVIEARGELFTVPAEKGDVRNLTNTPGARERDPAWSPDGKWIVFLSDESGEYEIHVAASDGKTPPRQVTKGGATFRYAPVWSPDSRKVAFSDKTMAVWWADVESGKVTKVDTNKDGEIFDYRWSPDSRWITYSKPASTGFSSVMVYSTETGKAERVSTGMTDDYNPVFEPEGKHLYFLSRRTLNPQIGGFELNMNFWATDRIYAVTLREDLPSPVAPESDEEAEEKKDGKEGETQGKEGKEGKEAKDGGEGKDGGPKKPEPDPVVIHLDGMIQRTVQVPVPAGRYAALSAVKGKLFYVKLGDPVFGDGPGPPPPTGSIQMYDLAERKEKTIISGVNNGYALSKDGGKLMYRSRDTFGIVEAKDGKKVGDGKIEPAGTLMALVDPKQEWLQMFNEAWRLERDFYYDPGMGGLSWKEVGERYRQLIPYVAHRADLNYILGEMQGELATSHAYVGGGDVPQSPTVGVGLLGADYELDSRSGLYRFKTIYRERDWSSPTAAPLAEPGVLVKEGDYLLSVNGRPLRAPQNVHSAFVGTDGKQTVITVGSRPDDPSPRVYTVKPIGHEGSLRYAAWVEANRRKVAEATGGRIAYIHVPNTAIGGMQQFTRQYYPQVDREGIIVDERFNGGGFIPDFFVERLRRTTMVYWSNRDGNDFRTPGTAIDGPKCILVNEYAGSGGDAFPYYFKMAGLGPIIGKRTWGGLVGISHNLPLMDGGVVTMPDFGMWDPAKGDWVVENHGVDPDIEVENAPHEMVAGRDPQLERAIQYVMDELKTSPPRKPVRPKYKVQQP
ncbi:MAG TPA: S41 family peptidase [Candidatus Polarisedimenticolia bacterium]|nr:S41 family peptidase [Candidatus Polarisedimenticolia bacterium]